MDISQISTDALRAALAQRAGVQDPILQASQADARAGLALHKSKSGIPWDAGDKDAVRTRILQVLSEEQE